MPCCAYPEELEQARRESGYLVIRDNSVEFNSPKVTRVAYVPYALQEGYFFMALQHDPPLLVLQRKYRTCAGKRQGHDQGWPLASEHGQCLFKTDPPRARDGVPPYNGRNSTTEPEQ